MYCGGSRGILSKTEYLKDVNAHFNFPRSPTTLKQYTAAMHTSHQNFPQ